MGIPSTPLQLQHGVGGGGGCAAPGPWWDSVQVTPERSLAPQPGEDELRGCASSTAREIPEPKARFPKSRQLEDQQKASDCQGPTGSAA